MRTALLLLALTAGLTGCSPGDAAAAGSVSPDVQAVLDHVSQNVIAATYADFGRRTADFDAACQRFAAAPSDALLADARAKWLAARVPWEQAEAFIFGPVTFGELDPSLDSWPLNTVDLDATLAGTDPVTADAVAALDPTTRGFQAAEYLLWGESGRRSASDLSPRERAYLVAVSTVMARDAARLSRDWSEAGADGGYATLLRTPGAVGNEAYASADDAVYELLMGVLFITEEVASEKIHVTLQSGTDRFAESRYSRSSAADIANNLQSVSNVYDGTFGRLRGPGLARLVAARSPDLDHRFRDELQAARAAVAAIPVSLEDAVTASPDRVEAAHQAVERVLRTLEDDLVPLVTGRTA